MGRKNNLRSLYNRWFKDKYSFAPEYVKERVDAIAVKYILANWADTALKDIDDAFALNYLTGLVGGTGTYSNKYNALGIFKDIADYGVKKRLMPYNPFLELRLPARQTKRHQALSDDDIHFIMQLDPHVMENVFFQIKLLTGTRTAECLGLCWSHVDFSMHTVKVCDQLQYIEGEDGKKMLGLCGHLKNFSPRVIHPPELTFRLLEIRREDQKKEMMQYNIQGNKEPSVQKPDFIFTKNGGMPVSPHEIYVAFRKAVPQSGRKGIRLHDLRITNATVTYRKTHDLRRVQGELGHSSPDVTMKYYIDPDPGGNGDIADAMDKYYWFMDEILRVIR